jgi:hypothetical protein
MLCGRGGVQDSRLEILPRCGAKASLEGQTLSHK